ncbi:MAG: GH32 C-terminal domain-containing protein [Muribaculaceae bacterium]|nr:GH32 C-terminal domain-containing protein [Muribaculaceae bacterium]
MKNFGKCLVSLVAAGSAVAAYATEKGVIINHLGVNNTLVRVTGEGKYLVMPVQESIDDAAVNILVDGKLERTIYVRLAKSKVDYTVPLDLTPYKGHDVVLNVVTSQSRSNIREAVNDACWSNFCVTNTFSTDNREKFRPAYHHTPLYGWMNDPNGMVYKDGEWHLYYQWNPYGSKWQNMTWGHSSSKDLLSWNHHPAAIEPNGLGAVFSGSCAIDKENTAGFGSDAIVALYTSAATSQVQSMAWSTDNGETFNIYPGNPVITLDSEARDPNMFRNPYTGKWSLMLAHALEHEMLVYSSDDLKNWTLESAFGKGLGAQGGVWECPDLFELEVEGTGEKKWMLICNLNPGGPFGGSAAQYFIGDFNGKTFIPDTDAEGKVPTKWMDFGKDHYATVSWSDAPENRRTVIGWMSNWQYAAEVPTTQFRSANTLPRDISLFRASDGQIYVKTAPAPEVSNLRDKLLRKTSATTGKNPKRFALPEANSGICEINVDIDAKKSKSVTLELSNRLGENVIMTYDPAGDTLSFDRRNSGIVDFSQDFPAVTVAPAMSGSNRISLRIFIDRSSIEVFDNNGRFVMTNLVFPNEPYSTLSVSSDGKAQLTSLQIHSLKATTL